QGLPQRRSAHTEVDHVDVAAQSRAEARYPALRLRIAGANADRVRSANRDVRERSRWLRANRARKRQHRSDKRSCANQESHRREILILRAAAAWHLRQLAGRTSSFSDEAQNSIVLLDGQATEES